MKKMTSKSARVSRDEREQLTFAYEHSKQMFKFAKLDLSCGHYEVILNVPGSSVKIATAINAIEWIEVRLDKELAKLKVNPVNLVNPVQNKDGDLSASASHPSSDRLRGSLRSGDTHEKNNKEGK